MPLISRSYGPVSPNTIKETDGIPVQPRSNALCLVNADSLECLFLADLALSLRWNLKSLFGRVQDGLDLLE